MYEIEVPKFSDNQPRKMVTLLALHTGCLYSQDILMVLISVRACVDPRDIVGAEKICQKKFPITPSGIEPATFWLLVQCFNQLRTPRRTPNLNSGI